MQETWVPSLSQVEIPWSGNGNPLQNPCLENPMDKGICPGGLQSTGLQRVRHNEVIQQQPLSGTLLTRKTLSQASIHFRKRKKNWDPWRECLSITMSNFPNRQSSQMRGDSWIPIKHSYTNKLVHDEEGWDRVWLDGGGGPGDVSKDKLWEAHRATKPPLISPFCYLFSYICSSPLLFTKEETLRGKTIFKHKAKVSGEI